MDGDAPEIGIARISRFDSEAHWQLARAKSKILLSALTIAIVAILVALVRTRRPKRVTQMLFAVELALVALWVVALRHARQSKNKFVGEAEIARQIEMYRKMQQQAADNIRQAEDASKASDEYVQRHAKRYTAIIDQQKREIERMQHTIDILSARADECRRLRELRPQN